MRPNEFLHRLAGIPLARRNDCGYEARYEYEDTSRMFGWGPEEGEGMCDYPDLCPLMRAGQCPLAGGETA
ncbi:MAG: hypothetical protein IRY83_04185 [Chloroflexi bacterium]|nr:hypothetical protein [Chloroflexota bacterium]